MKVSAIFYLSNGESKMYYYPEEFKGLDGETYYVYSFYGWGRGWRGFMNYIQENNANLQLAVELIENDTEAKSSPKYVKVKLLDIDTSIKVKEFAKKPYIRKDKSFRHV